MRCKLLVALALSCSRPAPTAVPAAREAAEAVRAAARGFYRDLASHDTPALLNHFWPAKVAARWEPPFEPAAARATAPLAAAIAPGSRAAASEVCRGGEAAVARAEVRISGSWARAIVPRCAGGDDEMWLLEYQRKWKIVRLALAGDG
jgi:hypothetical protein